MNYELAKKLKDAGFPQEEGGGSYIRVSGGLELMCGSVKVEEGDVYCPTLEELIDACGDRFESLDRFTLDGKTFGYTTNLYKTHKGVEVCETKLEAVAKLWLELNK